MKNKRKTIALATTCMLLGMAIFTACKKNETIKEKEAVSTDQMHKLMINGEPTYIKEENGQYFYADDIILTPEQFAFLQKLANPETAATERAAITTRLVRLWPRGVVYYTLNLGNDNAYARTAMNNISAVTPIRFVQRTNQSNYVNFVRANVNNSPIGMTGGRQTLNLYNSNNTGIITHEILHALGVDHEQCRPDRDNSVIINYNNIRSGSAHNFNKNFDTRGFGSFDFGSIMMYEPYAFSKNNKPTITRRDGSTYTTQINRLSQRDIAGLNQLY